MDHTGEIRGEPKRQIFRAMKEDDGHPQLGTSSSTLGVRRDTDIPVNDDGTVRPGTGGMSATPDDPRLLPQSRRPRGLAGGTGRDPVWRFDLGERQATVAYEQDGPGHGVVEPSDEMAFRDYVDGVWATAVKWVRHDFDVANEGSATRLVESEPLS